MFHYFRCVFNIYYFITTSFLDFVHRPDFHKPEITTFRKLDLFPSSAEEGGGHLLYKKPKCYLTTGDVIWKEDLTSPVVR
jgi:hypothetical protein